MLDHDKTIPVLDRGFVRYKDHMGDDMMVVNAARVSFKKESSWDYADSHVPTKTMCEKDKKLLSYLAKHKHWTPFAHPQICLHIKAPISIRTQLFKHKVGFVENEISRRYITEDPEVYNPQWRSKPTNGAKQGSEDFVTNDIDLRMMNGDYETATKLSMANYKSLIDQGVAPEQARFVLPQGTYTEWWWTGSLSAYARVYAQRTDAHAQWEVQQYADAIAKIIQPIFPLSWECLTSNRV